MSEMPFIAVDWGTTNRRAYVLRDGRVVATELSGPGAKNVARNDYSQEVAGIRQRLGDHPMLCAGMIGSRIGWKEIPYCALPVGLKNLATETVLGAPQTWIVPGIASLHGRPDVMRGEEVQLLGAVAAGLVPGNATLCQPGTHSKWAQIRDGMVVEFTTAMTGELFALLRDNSLLTPHLNELVVPSSAFSDGVERGLSCDIAVELFGVRARGLLQDLSDPDASALASGILIGAEVAARLPHVTGWPVFVLDDGALGPLYVEAIKLAQREATLISSGIAFCAGAGAIWDELAIFASER